MTLSWEGDSRLLYSKVGEGIGPELRRAGRFAFRFPTEAEENKVLP